MLIRRTSLALVSMAILALITGACGGSTPVTPSAGGSAGATASASASTDASPAFGPGSSPVVEFADSDDPTAAAKRERELIREAREAAGMAALIGANGAAAFDTLDAITAEYAQLLLRDASTAVGTGAFPTAEADPLAGQLASVGGAPETRRAAPDVIDISLFADTGFTASAIMSLFSEFVGRADQSGSGTLPREESREQTADGLRQQVTINTTMIFQTGNGQVSADITMSATDRIFDAASGSFVALYTSTSTGHFDVSACPAENGIAKGTYTFETKHELNDVATATASRSGAGRSAKAPFRLVNGEDAHLKQVEADLDLAADAHGPGSPGGPGPTGPFDWGAAQQVAVVMPAGSGGGSTWSGGTPSVTGTGGERAGGSMFMSTAMAALFLGEVGKEAERFWRSGKCFEMKTSEESRKVDPDEEVDVEVNSVTGKFGGGNLDKPVVAAFTGKERIDPASGTSMPMPARLTFKAGSEPRDKGTIELKQTSNRGIALKTLEFEVEPKDLWMKATGRLDQPSANLTLTLPQTKLEKTDQGYQGTVAGQVSGSVETLGCSKGVSVPMTFRVMALVDEADPDLVRLYAASTDFDNDEQVITCQGVTTKAYIPYVDFNLPFFGSAGFVEVRVDEPKTLSDSSAPEVQVTVTVVREEPPA